MTTTVFKCAACYSALAFAAPLSAESPIPASVEFSAAAMAAGEPAGAPHVVAIDYDRLYRRLMQAGMFSQVLGYALTVDAEGKVIGCSFSRDFRREVTRRDLCRAFTRSFAFEPARGAEGEPVAGIYRGKVEIASFFQPNL